MHTTDQKESTEGGALALQMADPGNPPFLIWYPKPHHEYY